MISLITASALRSDKGGSRSLTHQECQEFLAPYALSKIRLWAYHCSLSRLVLRIDRPADESFKQIDLLFVGVSDIRSPVHWLLGAIEIRQDQELSKTLFAVPSADVLISASDLTIIVQDEWPHKVWELESARFA
jgi:hypothetical protein